MTAHLSTDELVRWRDHGAAADRDRVIAHLAACDECGAAYVELLDLAPADEGPAALRAADFLARGRAIPPGRGRLVPFLVRPWRRPWPSVALATAVAAMLVVALVPGVRRMVGGVTPPAEEGGIRATTILLVEPVGEVSAPIRFVWRSPVRSARYRVEVTDAGGRLLGSLTTSDEQASPSPELRHALSQGGPFQWAVTALDDHGAPVLSSPPESFRLPSTDPGR